MNRRRAGLAASHGALKLLERRIVCAALTVNTLLDNTTSDNFPSIREAVALANFGGGTYAIGLTAANGNTLDATQTLTLTINQGPAITSADHVTFTAGSSVVGMKRCST